jgi:MFS transporter, DHA2 family, multidrug resistance protein
VATVAASQGSALPERADATAWIAVAAGALGALLATLDISIVNSALPTIQGEIGASGTEGTWIATAFLVAEIIIIPLSAWLERLLGLRTLLIIAVVAFTGFSIVCGVATTLLTMIIGRTGQGLVGGALIPTAMTIVAKRLPPRQQPIGMALFGMTVILGPVLGPLLGGWLTENLSWHYIFFVNVPVCVVLLLLLLLGLPHERTNWVYLREADWLGIIGMVLGLGGMTIVLEEGQREEWFESSLIIRLTIVAIVGFALLLIGQFTARRPVLKLRLVLTRHFGGVVIMALALGMVMFGSMFVIPQFLAVLADYNALQTGYVVFLMGLPAFALMPILPLLMRILDIRIALSIALLLLAVSCFLTDSLTTASAGGDFTASQLVRGVGAVLLMLYLNQSAVAAVAKEDAGDASAIFNAARNLGGSFALAAVGTLLERRMWLHSRRIEETLPANQWHVQDYLGGLTHSSGSTEGAFRMLNGAIQQQALTMTYNDIFWGMGILTLLTVPLAFLLRPLPKNISLAMH